MGIGAVLAAAGAVAAFLFGCCVAQGGLRAFSSVARQLQMRLAAGSDAGVVRRALRQGIPRMGPVSDLLLRNAAIARYVEDLRWALGQRHVAADASALLQCLMVAGTGMALAGTVVGGSVLAGLLLCAGAFAATGMAAKSKRQQASEQVREAVPDALHAMGACFKSGLSLLQTFQHLAQEVQGPLQSAFQRAAGSMEAGGTPDEALEVLRKEAQVPEIMFVSVALEVQHRSGGSMQSVLDAARESVATELRLDRQLRVQTAQARLSAQVVTIMPFLLVGAISLMSPGFLAPFFTSLAGAVLLLLALSMQVAGVMLARRMLQVR